SLSRNDTRAPCGSSPCITGSNRSAAGTIEYIRFFVVFCRKCPLYTRPPVTLVFYAHVGRRPYTGMEHPKHVASSAPESTMIVANSPRRRFHVPRQNTRNK